jgi:acetyl-CoA/propionyl-CoA carboxylase biotin carboxyl carrier protein
MRWVASTPGDSYLLQDKLIEVAKQAGADAVHPGYGFLAENGPFAQKVIDAGLVWIGPGPEAIDSLGDKVKARHIALKANAPLVPGTKDPVEGLTRSSPSQGARPAGGRSSGVWRWRARPQGRPHAGGDPRALRLRRPRGRHGFGRGECFVEKFLDHPRPRRDPVPGRPARQCRRRLDP